MWTLKIEITKEKYSKDNQCGFLNDKKSLATKTVWGKKEKRAGNGNVSLVTC